MDRVPETEARASRGSTRRLAARGDAVVACMLGWVICAVVTGARIQRTDPFWTGPDSALHLAIAVGHLLGVGAIPTVLVWLHGLRPARSRWARRAWVAVAAAPLLHVVLAEDLGGLTQRLASVATPSVTVAASAIAAAILVALAVEAGARMRGPWRRRLALLVGAVAIWIEPEILRGLYPGFHALLVLTAASLLGSALHGAALPRLLGRRPRRVAAALATLGLAAHAVPVSPVVHFLVARDGDVVAQLAGSLLPRSRDDLDPACEEAEHESPWLVAGGRIADAPPTPGERFAPNPVVVLLTVDCLRYDLVAGRLSPSTLPTLARLRAEGTLFSRAYAPGASTVYTLTSMFSGRYYSQLEWSGRGSAIWPGADRTTRFPELLRGDGVWTVHAASFDWLDEARGVARGFDVVDYRALPGPRWKPAESLADALVRRLGEVGDRRAFFYTHFNDAHLPYDRGGLQGSAFDRYVRELALVDAQVGRILDAIDELGLTSRTIVIVTSDHGEAFGEHGRTAHSSSLYEELIHVPLVVRGPGVAVGATTAAPTSLVDLGPTILDIFGLVTPAHFMGESLYPALAGHPIHPTRPIIAQAGPLRCLVTREGVKVIRDVRRGTLEAYDLRTDPGEARNLIGMGRDDVREALHTLDCFFATHRFRRPGYVEPLR